jgi:hypothetical protein
MISKFLELGLCAISLGVALPMSVALFQQRGMITKDEIEVNLREFKNEQGELVQEFYFNKGL